MDTLKPKLCRFCFSMLSDENYKLIENIIVEMMDVLLIEINFAITKEAVICTSCFQAVEKLFFFKSTCLDVEESINQYMRLKNMLRVNILEVYLNEKTIGDYAKNYIQQRICRFCLNLSEDNILNEIKEEDYLMDALQKFYPELDLNSTDTISACNCCLDFLNIHYKFAANCTNIEKKVNTYLKMMQKSNNEIIDLESVLYLFPDKEEDILKLPWKNGCATEVQTAQLFEICKNVSPINEVFEEKPVFDDSLRLPLEVILHNVNQRGQKLTQEINCSQCNFVADQNHPIKDLINTVQLRIANMKACPQNQHKINRQSTSMVTHKCDQCPYEGRQKSSLVNHMIKHKKPTEITTYVCEICRFETKYKQSLDTHLLLHKSGNEVVTFKCEECSFTAKYKGNLKKHMLVHKSRSEVTMYKCETCPFETKHKVSLKTHMLRHKSLSEVTMFKCQHCDFVARHKGNLKLHLLTHKDAFETVMYKCEQCAFETKHKMSLKTHMVKHRDLSEVQMHKCETCGFETWHKGNLKKHVVKHKSPSEIKMYRCDVCEFRTKHRDSFKTHQAIHSPRS